jgi:hypothetical protein
MLRAAHYFTLSQSEVIRDYQIRLTLIRQSSTAANTSDRVRRAKCEPKLNRQVHGRLLRPVLSHGSLLADLLVARRCLSSTLSALLALNRVLLANSASAGALNWRCRLVQPPASPPSSAP